MAIKTLCEVNIPVLNEEGDQIEEEGTPKEITEQFYLLHWGLQAQIVVNGENIVPYTETVGICQNIVTGFIRLFHPEQIRIIGVAPITKTK